MGALCSASAKKVAPEITLISMILSFEKDDDILNYIKKNPKSIFDADNVRYRLHALFSLYI